MTAGGIVVSEKSVKALVIGAGPGGYTAGIRLGQLGIQTIIVEKSEVGGTCLNRGCIPAKALLSASDYYESANFWKNAGIEFDGLRADLVKLQAWKKGVVQKLDRGVEFILKSHKVEILPGSATFVGHKRVRVEGDGEACEISAENIVIATGSEPAPLKGLPTDGRRIVTSDEALDWTEAPQRLLIVGAGAVGLELAVVYQRFGARVTVVEMMDQILPGMDAESAFMLERSLRKRGIDIRLSSLVSAVEDSADRLTARIVPREGGAETWIETDRILVAVGRRPVTAPLGLSATGLHPAERGFIKVNAHRETEVAGIYAIGDCAEAPLLAHKAMREGIVAAERIAGKTTTYDVRGVPAVVYTEPELASVGLTEEQAKETGADYTVGKFPFTASGRAVTMGRAEGQVKVIADRETHTLLGVHIVGPNASELIAEPTLALEMGATVHDVAWAIHAHPTLSEAVAEAMENYFGKAIHILNK
jgi:dihydrolipoamide dehydrogenase